MVAKSLQPAQRYGAGILPPDAERALMKASTVGKYGSSARMAAIDRAYEYCEERYPTRFRKSEFTS
jgi:hypothetical protein